MAYWNSVEFSNLLSNNRDDASYLLQLKAIVNRLYSIIHTDEFALDDIQPTRFSNGILVDRTELYNKRIDMIGKSLKNIQDPKASSYKPFDISEISAKKIFDSGFLMSKKVRNMSKRLDRTPTNGFDPQGTKGSIRASSISKFN